MQIRILHINWIKFTHKMHKASSGSIWKTIFSFISKIPAVATLAAIRANIKDTLIILLVSFYCSCKSAIKCNKLVL